MPNALKKTYAGLPLWAWLALAATGVTVGMILRAKSGKAGEDESEGDPCDPESEFYDPTKCNSVEGSRLNAGYDSADPCDPTSVTYDPAACQATAGIGYESAGGMAGPGGVYVEAPQSPTEGELEAAEDGGIEGWREFLEREREMSPGVVINQTINTTGCNPKKKLPKKKGFKVVCESGRWGYEPLSHADKKRRQRQHQKLTGGGAPNKQHNKTHGHGKKRRRRHKVRH